MRLRESDPSSTNPNGFQQRIFLRLLRLIRSTCYQRLHGEGRYVGGAYVEAAVTSSRRQTGRVEADGGDMGLRDGGPEAKVDEENYRRAAAGDDI
jgi:hypothetical protein